MIRFTCDNCGRGFELPDKAAGLVGTCADCGQRVRVPGNPDVPGIPGAGVAAPPEEAGDDLAALAAAAREAQLGAPAAPPPAPAPDPRGAAEPERRFDPNEETVADDEADNQAGDAGAAPSPAAKPLRNTAAEARPKAQHGPTAGARSAADAPPPDERASPSPAARGEPARSATWVHPLDRPDADQPLSKVPVARPARPAARRPERGTVAERGDSADRPRPSPLAFVSLAVGVAALGTAWWPMVGLTVSLVGLTLGTAAVILFSVRREPWIGLPIAGLGLSLGAFIIGGVMLMSLGMSLLRAGEGALGGLGGAGDPSGSAAESGDPAADQHEQLQLLLERLRGASAEDGSADASGGQQARPLSPPRDAEQGQRFADRPRIVDAEQDPPGSDGSVPEARRAGAGARGSGVAEDEPEWVPVSATVAYGPVHVRVASVRLGAAPGPGRQAGGGGPGGALSVEVELTNRGDDPTVAYQPWAAGGAAGGSRAAVTLTDDAGRGYRLLNRVDRAGPGRGGDAQAPARPPRRSGPRIPEGLGDLEGIEELMEGYSELFDMIGELQGLAESGSGVGGADPEMLEMARRALGEARGGAEPRAERRPLPPGRPARQTLVFEPPAGDTEELRLELPAEHIGGAGPIRFRISTDTIDGF